MLDLIKQADLEAQYDIFRRDSAATDREVAIRLARFAEAKIYGQFERSRKRDDSASDVGIVVGIITISSAAGMMAGNYALGWLVFGGCLLTWGIVSKAASYDRK